MSNALAVAAVTESLRSLIEAALAGAGVAGAVATAVRPDSLAGLPTVGVNVFLYQVTANLACQNADLPTRSADGSLLRRPRAAFDLHYLLTFYGDDAAYEPQRLLGATLLQLHARPVLAREFVRQVQASHPVLAGADLADQVDVVRVRPANLNLDETNKLWMTFPNVDYVLSVAYVAGVVLIETDDLAPASAVPVRSWGVRAIPFSLAAIDSVSPQPVDPSASSPTLITLSGRNLSPTDRVSFTTPGEAAPIPGADPIGDGGGQLVIALPAGLRAGLNTVQLTRLEADPSRSSDPPRVVLQSNAAPFLLRPQILDLGRETGSNRVTVTVRPAVGPRQDVTLLLNGLGASAPAAFAVGAPPRTAPTVTLEFDLSGLPAGSLPPELAGGSGGSVPPGRYLVRVRVDGAESALRVDGDPATIQGPTVTL